MSRDDRRARPVRRWPLMGALFAVLALGTACAREQTATVSVDRCRDLLDRAAIAREVDQQLTLLDAALVVCRDADTFSDGLRFHPGAIGVTPATFIQRRCESPPDQVVARSSICLSVAPEGLITGGDNAEAAIYVGITLDGRRVELRSDRVAFTDGRPSGIVEVVEVGTRRGCDGLAELYQRWIPLVGLEDRGDEWSVYTQHTLNVMASQGCEPPDGDDDSDPDGDGDDDGDGDSDDDDHSDGDDDGDRA